MKKLVSFGCSFTYGHGLQDCVTSGGRPGEQPSQFAWPSMLANRLGMTIDNKAGPGCSNLEILLRVIKYQFDPSDTVVIMWSFIERDFIFKKYGNIEGTKLGHWEKKDIFKHWALTHDIEDMGTRSWFYMQHADLYIKSQGARCLHFVMKPAEYAKFKPDYINIDINPLINGYMMLEIDRAADGHHPGPKGHEYIAKRMETLINGNS